MKIYVDASGNDFGELNILEACEDLLRKNSVEVGIYISVECSNINAQKIRFMKTNFSNKVNFVVCDKSLKNDEKYRSGENSTTEKAIHDMYTDHRKDCAFVSCANIKHISLISFKAEKTKLINIPSALVQIIPTLCDSKRIMLDLGASIDPDLFALGLIAKVFVSTFFHLRVPKIGFLNIGSESNKGLPSVINAAKAYHSFVGQEYLYGNHGFIEPDEVLLNNECNAVVCSGVHGNITIKSLKGITKVIADTLKQNKLTAALAYPALRTFRDKFNYDFYNGALVTRFSRLIVKAHGSSNKQSFIYALERTEKIFMPKFYDFYNACIEISQNIASYRNSGT